VVLTVALATAASCRGGETPTRVGADQPGLTGNS
jgi:hypothetical protein